MDRVLQKQIAYYRARAGEYDDFWLRRGDYALPPEQQVQWDADAAETLQWIQGLGVRGDVLELACGTGLFTQHFVNDADTLLAIDASPECLALNEQRLHDPRITYAAVDLFGWEPLPAAYDWVVFTYWLSHVPDDRLAAFWDKVGRALRPGGRVALVDSCPRTGADAGAAGATAELRTLRDGRRFSVVKRYWSPAELTGELDVLGWEARARATVHRMILVAEAAPRA